MTTRTFKIIKICNSNLNSFLAVNNITNFVVGFFPKFCIEFGCHFKWKKSFICFFFLIPRLLRSDKIVYEFECMRMNGRKQFTIIYIFNVFGISKYTFLGFERKKWKKIILIHMNWNLFNYSWIYSIAQFQSYANNHTPKLELILRFIFSHLTSYR